MKRVRNKTNRDEHKVPSKVAVAAKAQTGGGLHQESKASRAQRTGRLQGAEKRRIMIDRED